MDASGTSNATLGSISCVVMRGGTSRGLFFHDRDLPADHEQREKVLLAAIGGTSPRQVDGLGGADLLLSKIAVVAPSQKPDVDVECSFVSVTPNHRTPAYGVNCGNLIAAVALFAIEEGLASRDQPRSLVRIHNTDSGGFVHAHVGAREDAGLTAEACQLAGMPATGSLVELEFLNPVGTVQDRLLPTETAANSVKLLDGRSVQMTIVDAGALYAFVPAGDLGLSGVETTVELQDTADLMETLEYLRGCAAVLSGLVDSPEEAIHKTRAIPKLALVAPPVGYKIEGSGTYVEAESIDLVSRIVSCQELHKAYAVTGGIATAVAACVPGSTVQHATGLETGTGLRSIRIGHASGVMETGVQCSAVAPAIVIDRATCIRTARRIMAGSVLIPQHHEPSA